MSGHLRRRRIGFIALFFIIAGVVSLVAAA
jgi:hypothetical protein